jgi:cytidine deaminase
MRLSPARRSAMLRRVKGTQSRLPALLRAATRARLHAYAPYSGFQVGAAVLAGGRIFAAANLENSSYPLCVCAERNAVAMAVAAGFRNIEAVAVVAGRGRPAPPCGGCRQVLAEFCAPGTPVTYAASDGRSVTTSIAGLLPDAFRPADLQAVQQGVRARAATRAAAPVRRTRARRR